MATGTGHEGKTEISMFVNRFPFIPIQNTLQTMINIEKITDTSFPMIFCAKKAVDQPVLEDIIPMPVPIMIKTISPRKQAAIACQKGNAAPTLEPMTRHESALV